MASHIPTRFFVVSDTHGDELKFQQQQPEGVDVAIHCGDLTEESKMHEFRAAIELLKGIKAPLKLVIAGNHDWTLDTPTFKKKLADLTSSDDELVRETYGAYGEARKLFDDDDAKAAGIVFLDEGTHSFTLSNGALLTVYASPYTPSLSDMGFQYHPEVDHEWDIKANVDVAITHGPPRGVLDLTSDRRRAGSPSLFGAVARAKPQMHCFGHIHESWGAKKVAWRETISEVPSHFTDIDNDRSTVIESLPAMRPNKFDDAEMRHEKASKLKDHEELGYCTTGEAVQKGTETLFVNAAIEGETDDSQHLPWLVTLDLPQAQATEASSTASLTSSKKRKPEEDISDVPSKRR